MKKKVVLIVPHTHYDQIEYEHPKQALDKHFEIEVITASNRTGTAVATTPEEYVVEEQAKTTTFVDKTIEELDPYTYDMFIFIGGSGVFEHLAHDSVYEFIKKCHNIEKPLAASGTAPRLFAKATILEGKDITGWNDDGLLDGIAARVGARNLQESVVKDGRIITSTGKHAVEEFTKTLIDTLEV